MRSRLVLTLGAGGLLVGALLLPAAAAAGSPADRFRMTVTNPWENGGDNPDTMPSAFTSLCRTSGLFSTGNPYAATTNVDAIVGDALNNPAKGSNKGCVAPQNETTVAVNPLNPLNLVAGTNDYRVCCDLQGFNDGTGWAYASVNGGATWTNVQLPGLTVETGGQGIFKRFDAAGDPVVAFGADGTVYYANIVFSRVSPASGVAVSSSTDGGLTWGAPNLVTYTAAGNFFNDKEWIAAGPDGTVVVTWTVFNQGPHGASYISSPIVMALSRDGGHTWNRQGSPVSDSSHPYNQGSVPAFAPDGTLYVAYEGATPDSGYNQDAAIIARSTDLGRTFTNTEIGRVYDDLDCYPISGGRQTLSGEAFRINSFPSFAIDPTTGKLAIAWADNQGSGSCGGGGSTFSGTTSNQVKLVTSTDGLTFSAPSTITSGAADKVYPAVAANGGKIAVSYYTRAYSPDTAVCAANGTTIGQPVCLDVAARGSSDGFGAETRLTTESSNPFIQFNGTFIGDYTGIAMGSDGLAHPVWTDFRGHPGLSAPLGQANQDAYTEVYRP